MSEYNTFIVRIWSDNKNGLHGRISHVASQEQRDFRDMDRMVEFMLGTIGRPRTLAQDFLEGKETEEET